MTIEQLETLTDEDILLIKGSSCWKGCTCKFIKLNERKGYADVILYDGILKTYHRNSLDHVGFRHRQDPNEMPIVFAHNPKNALGYRVSKIEEDQNGIKITLEKSVIYGRGSTKKNIFQI